MKNYYSIFLLVCGIDFSFRVFMTSQSAILDLTHKSKSILDINIDNLSKTNSDL